MCTVERVHAGRMRGGGRGSEVRTNVCGREGACEEDEGGAEEESKRKCLWCM